MNIMKRLVVGGLSGMLTFHSMAQEVTEIAITDKVLVKDCVPFGVNYVGAYEQVKKPIVFNFEGVAHRLCTEGEIFSDGFYSYIIEKKAIEANQLCEFYKGGTITILSGSAKGEKRKIDRVEIRKRWTWFFDVVKKPEPPENAFFYFDKPISGLSEDMRVDLQPFHDNKKDCTKEFKADPTKNVGAMIERDYLDTGFDGYNYRQWAVKKELVVSPVQGDVPKDSFGKTALQVAAADVAKEGKIMLTVATDTETNCNGIYKISFWAKVKEGSPELTLGWNDPKETPAEKIALGSDWKQFSFNYDFKGKYPATCTEAKPKSPRSVSCYLAIKGGTLLLDDVVVSMEGDTNPTPFRDESVDVLKKLRPGILRQLMEGGDCIQNLMQVREKQNAISGYHWNKHDSKMVGWFNQRRFYTSISEYLTLCEYLQCGAWYNISGTLYPEEVDALMEYLGAPADVGLGKLRAEQGHPKPWTESIPRIHIEFGNEIWNFMGDYKVSSYSGPDYWDGMIVRAKASPHYRKNVLFTMGVDGQFENVPNADLVMNRAPYVCHMLSKEMADRFPQKEELARWIFGSGLDQNVTGKSIKDSSAKAIQAGKEIAVYEVNYHTTETKETEAIRNEFLVSQGAGVNIANTMLGQLKQHGVRYQCFFSDRGVFNVGGATTQLWGIILSSREGKARFRPAFLGLSMVNQVMDGNVLETTQTGANPTFSTLPRDLKKKDLPPVSYPVLYSYAFANGKKRGLVLVNLTGRLVRKQKDVGME